jgi:hypothetical protein
LDPYTTTKINSKLTKDLSVRAKITKLRRTIGEKPLDIGFSGNFVGML